MRLLVDTHILLAVVEGRLDTLNRPMREALSASTAMLTASVVSLWEIAIKVRLGKLPLRGPLRQLPDAVTRFGITLLDVQASHVVVEAQPLPPTRDPFDRLLLSQCLVENLRLVTLDRALAAHPLAWRPA
jgi:PIN domain nuclease of toxin-antitoxin system